MNMKGSMSQTEAQQRFQLMRAVVDGQAGMNVKSTKRPTRVNIKIKQLPARRKVPRPQSRGVYLDD